MKKDMIFLIDSCFWLHTQMLFSALNIDLRIILHQFRWGYTKYLLEEYKHYQLENFIPLQEGFQIPVSENELSTFQQKHSFISEFDVSDQSLLYCAKRDDEQILTDDGGLLAEITSWRLKGYRLPPFCLRFIQDGYISKKSGNQMLKFWENNGLYNIHSHKTWKKELQMLK